MKQTTKPVNRATRREKTVRTPGYAYKPWVKGCAVVAVLSIVLVGMIAMVFSK